MTTVKNTGVQPRGFWDENFNHVVVPPGQEAQFNMSENDYKKNQEILENCGDPKPYEISGGAGGAKGKVAMKAIADDDSKHKEEEKRREDEKRREEERNKGRKE
jgi:hypothetical protein